MRRENALLWLEETIILQNNDLKSSFAKEYKNSFKL